MVKGKTRSVHLDKGKTRSVHLVKARPVHLI